MAAIGAFDGIQSEGADGVDLSSLKIAGHGTSRFVSLVRGLTETGEA
tara:strand:+ start:3654 stop:3794 length:141 start_codon:yes stop_codon:yes gene_type:complete